MPTIRGEVEILRVVLETVLLEEMPEFLPGCELDPAGAVDVDVPPPRLLAVFPLLQFPHPAVRQPPQLRLLLLTRYSFEG